MYKFIALFLGFIMGFVSLVSYAASTETTGDFALTKIDIISSKKLDLTFNKDLQSSTGAIRTFKLVNKVDDLATIKVLKNKLIKKDQIEIELEKDMLKSTDYELTVVSIKDIKGNNITKGVNGIIEFKTPKEFIKNAPVSFMNGNLPEETPVQLEDATYDKNNVAKQADDVEKLPKTGPEHWLIIAFAIMFGTIVYVLRLSKSRI